MDIDGFFVHNHIIRIVEMIVHGENQICCIVIQESQKLARITGENLKGDSGIMVPEGMKMSGNQWFTERIRHTQPQNTGEITVVNPAVPVTVALLPGTVVKAGAVVEYAILGEGCVVGEGCHVGGVPGSSESWGLTVLAPNCQVADGREVAAGIVLDRNAEEVSK